MVNYFSELDILALSLNGSQLREAVAENLALKRVGISRQELNSDPVAKREYEDRLTAAEQAEDQMPQDLIAYPAESNWYHQGEKQLVNSKRAIQNHVSEEDLGIEKFPSEKSIYRSVLRETGLHQYNEELEHWELCAPSFDGRKDKKSNMRHVWKRIDEFLDSTEKEPKSLAELNAELLAPPYGVKAGLLPIFYVAAYLVYQHELALYEKRMAIF